jgi:hypothetical protein
MVEEDLIEIDLLHDLGGVPFMTRLTPGIWVARQAAVLRLAFLQA